MIGVEETQIDFWQDFKTKTKFQQFLNFEYPQVDKLGVVLSNLQQ